MNKLTIQFSILLLLLPLVASTVGCGSGGDNPPLPKGQVPEWRQKNQSSANHPKDPNLPPGEK